MSLLLLYLPGIASTGTSTSTGFVGWSTVAKSTSSWTLLDPGYKDLWGEWGGYTWNHIYDVSYSSNRTWDYMSGQTFQTTTGNTTTWTRATTTPSIPSIPPVSTGTGTGSGGGGGSTGSSGGIPSGALLDAGGNPILDANGNYILGA